MQRPVLGYWAFRGYAEPIRMLLRHLEVDFEDMMYQQGDAPDYDRSEWLNVKETLGMEFPNLPYWIDEDIKLSETFAILEYVAAKYSPSYLGNNMMEETHVVMMQGVLKDLKTAATKPCLSSDALSLIPLCRESLKPTLIRIGSFLEGKRFLIGDHPTWIDFYLFELLDQIETMCPGILAENSQNFSSYKDNVRSLAHVEEFIARPRMPFNYKKAGWGNK
ncbi:unnamed protein product [Blepharisma stoltei]|uniref:glutathione transferase n=1 Tax=Blepharisma stoltei TaxID=1481888 RepID=A0AAU9IUK5_9CILI|nr:unnamed protein product [Blepharisma stoltei]